MVNVWLEYQGITRTAKIQTDFYNYLVEEMMYNTYIRFMIQRIDGRRRKIIESNDDYVYEQNPLFVQINGDPVHGIALHVTPTKKISKERDGTETQ